MIERGDEFYEYLRQPASQPAFSRYAPSFHVTQERGCLINHKTQTNLMLTL